MARVDHREIERFIADFYAIVGRRKSLREHRAEGSEDQRGADQRSIASRYRPASADEFSEMFDNED